MLVFLEQVHADSSMFTFEQILMSYYILNYAEPDQIDLGQLCFSQN